MKSLIALCVLGLVIASSYVAYQSSSSGQEVVNYRTATVRRDDLVVSVSATGTLEPEDLVDVGAQVVGRVDKLGEDTSGKQVDYGSRVEANQVLAHIDDSVYRGQWHQAKAALQRAKAEMQQLEAKLKYADQEQTRTTKLRSHKAPAISEAEHDLAVTNYEQAKASIDVGKAAVDQAEAALELAQTNLEYTVIRSPVSGTIIDRRVNIGQTVVSNLNAPSLFLIAKDLRRMQVWASVNEADIGLIKVGMPVRFSVDAFPEEVFEGEVIQVRLNATMTQNVVTYTVVIANDNSDLKLLPYLTADVKFLIKQIPNVLLVPNGALRYQPAPERIAPDAPRERTSQDASVGAKHGTVWVRDGNFVRPVAVTIGDTDGSQTEVSSDQLSEGDAVVLGESKAAAAEVTNPFGPPKIPKKAATSNQGK